MAKVRRKRRTVARTPKLALPSTEIVAVDTETTGFSTWKGEQPFAIGFCGMGGETAYVEWPVDPFTRIVMPDVHELEQVVDWLLSRKQRVAFHNAKFDVRQIESLAQQYLGVDLFDRTTGRLGFDIHETTFMAWCCNGLEPTFKLKSLAQKYLDYPKDDEEDLQKLVNRLRRKGKAAGWQIAYTMKPQDDGTFKQESQTAADYWLPRAAMLHHPEWLGIKAEPAEVEQWYCRKYCLGDVERTMLLCLMYLDVMEEEEVRHTYDEEVEELWPITYAMEDEGIHFHKDICDEEERNALDELHRYKQEVIDAAWPEFTGTPKDLQKLLYDKDYLGLPVRVRTAKTKEPATNVQALQEYEDHPVVRSIHKWRAAHKAWSTYFRRYNRLSNVTADGDWEMHGEFRQLYPVTRRYSSSAPNLQNVANASGSRSTEPIQARMVFGPRAGCVWYMWDYQQLEVRIFADVAQEPTMLEAIASGQNMHAMCTNKAWGGEGNPAAIYAATHALELDGTGPPKDRKKAEVLAEWEHYGIRRLRDVSASNVDEICRDWLARHDHDIVKAEATLKKKNSYGKAKMILFAKQFGGTAKAVKDLLRCSYDEAAQFMDDYSVAFPRMDEYMEEIRAEGLANGYVVCRYGTKLAINRDKPYQACNRVVQGSAASLLKRSMIRCAEYLRSTGLDARIVLTVHDELVFEFRKEHAHRSVIMKLGQIMSDHEGHFGVPTPVELERVKAHWNQKSKVKWADGPVYPDGLRKEAA